MLWIIELRMVRNFEHIGNNGEVKINAFDDFNQLENITRSICDEYALRTTW